jgi:hypothetical protein
MRPRLPPSRTSPLLRRTPPTPSLSLPPALNKPAPATPRCTSSLGLSRILSVRGRKKTWTEGGKRLFCLESVGRRGVGCDGIGSGVWAGPFQSLFTWHVDRKVLICIAADAQLPIIVQAPTLDPTTLHHGARVAVPRGDDDGKVAWREKGNQRSAGHDKPGRAGVGVGVPSTSPLPFPLPLSHSSYHSLPLSLSRLPRGILTGRVS